LDAYGNLFIADTQNNRIRKVSAGGMITTVAGNGTAGYSGDGGPAISARLAAPSSVAVDASGNLFIADTQNNRVRKVSLNGIITTLAGTGIQGYSGDEGPAASAQFAAPMAVAVDTSGNLFVADYLNNRIRKVSVSGVITTVAGNGAKTNVGGNGGFSGDGGPATLAALFEPNSVALDASGNLFIADAGNGRIRKVAPGGTITTIAGGGTNPCGFYDAGCVPPTGDGGPATSAVLGPSSVAVDVAGNLFINARGIRIVPASGIISTVPGTSAFSSSMAGIALDAYGNLFFAETATSRIREVSLVAAPALTSSGTPVQTMGIRLSAMAASAATRRLVIWLH
jgi:sugar lactone lactonase YvrE